jgi:hypothetical protein
MQVSGVLLQGVPNGGLEKAQVVLQYDCQAEIIGLSSCPHNGRTRNYVTMYLARNVLYTHLSTRMLASAVSWIAVPVRVTIPPASELLTIVALTLTFVELKLCTLSSTRTRPRAVPNSSRS